MTGEVEHVILYVSGPIALGHNHWRLPVGAVQAAGFFRRLQPLEIIEVKPVRNSPTGTFYEVQHFLPAEGYYVVRKLEFDWPVLAANPESGG